MTDTEMEQYVKCLIKKYDYYDPIKDRIESLRLGGVRNKDILDIGSGRGYLAILAAKKFNCNVTTIDISEDKIKIAKENARKESILDRIKFKLSNAVNTSFKNNSFYAVVSFNALHHSKGDHEKIIKEMFRVAKEKVVVTELGKAGVEAFDRYIHPESNHKNMAIDLNRLEYVLRRYCRVRRYDRKLMSTFVCDKTEVVK